MSPKVAYGTRRDAKPGDFLICSKCGATKTFEQFNLRENGVPKSECKKCWNAWRAEYRKMHPEETSQQNWWDNLRKACRAKGISPEDYFKAFEIQNGKCAICTSELKAGVGKGKSAAIDHCHRTGKFRGLLCGNCNTALGLLKENLDNFTSAVAYLLTDTDVLNDSVQISEGQGDYHS